MYLEFSLVLDVVCVSVCLFLVQGVWHGDLDECMCISFSVW